MDRQAVLTASNELAKTQDTDVFIFNSGFVPGVDKRVAKAIRDRVTRKNVSVVLVSEGGDPDSAYRISRLFQGSYDKFTAIISGWCKSAGTLCALGAHELVFGDFGELGPLDIQYYKKDEIGEMASGLVVREALSKLHTHAFDLFENSMLGITAKGGGQISFKVASDVAVRLAVGICEPLYKQIDPIVLGDLERGMTIAKAYGERLQIKGKNFRLDKLQALVESYPSHGFVIDIREAETLFENVRPCNENEQELLVALEATGEEPDAKGVVRFLSDERGEDSSEVGAKSTDEGEPDSVEKRDGRARSDAENPRGADATVAVADGKKVRRSRSKIN